MSQYERRDPPLAICLDPSVRVSGPASRAFAWGRLWNLLTTELIDGYKERLQFDETFQTYTGRQSEWRLPDILTFEHYQIKIGTSGNITAGESLGWRHAPVRYSAKVQTTGVPENVGDVPFRVNAKVATGVDSGTFFELLISRLTTDGV